MNADIQKLFFNSYNILKKYENLGTKETKYAYLIAKAPHIGKEAWLHSVFKPISKHQIEEMNSIINKIPSVYEEFLLSANGFSIFGTTLSLYGYRFNYKRDLENIWQPFDLIELNNNDRPSDSKDSFFFIGSYDWDGSYIYINKDNLKVFRCTQESSTPITSWECFDDFLDKEILRISKLFNNYGEEIDENKETTPSVI